MEAIRGNNVIGYVNISDTLIPIFCGIDCVFKESKDVAEATGAVGSSVYNRLQNRSWSVEISGFTKIDSTDGQLDYFSIITSPFTTDAHDITIVFDDIDLNEQTITGTMFCQKSSINGPVKEFATASALFIGTGPYHTATDTGSGSGGSFCVPVSGTGFAPPDGTSGTAYSYTLALLGTNPKTIGATTKPSWMTASIVAGNLKLTGTPAFGDVGSAVVVSIQVLNACGDQTFSDTINIVESGRNVFVINSSSVSIDVTNSNGHVYTFGASNANNGNIKMPSDTLTVSLSGTKNYEFLQSLPITVINSGNTGSGTITTSNLSVTNYLRFTD